MQPKSLPFAAGFIFISLRTLIMISLLAGNGYGQSSILYVKADATGTSDGTSWENAFTDLQSALGQVELGMEIYVAAGTYKPSDLYNPSDSDPTDSRMATFRLDDEVHLYGGFNGTETSKGQRDISGHETILSGDIGVVGDNTDNCYRVVVGTDNGILDGFTIMGGNGNGDSPYFDNGGGIQNNGV